MGVVRHRRRRRWRDLADPETLSYLITGTLVGAAVLAALCAGWI